MSDQLEGDQPSGSVSIATRSPHDAVWDLDLFLHRDSAQIWSCTMCGHVPKKCMADASENALCEGCAKPLQNTQKIIHSSFVDKQIGKMEIKCKNKLVKLQQVDAAQAPVKDDAVQAPVKVDAPQAPVKDDEKKVDNNAAAPASEACDWKGQVKDWQNHNDINCLFTIITCEHCNKFKCSRKLMKDHYDLCPEKSIDCTQGCGEKILRKNTDNHIAAGNTDNNINACNKTILKCINKDCTIEKERIVYQTHVKDECVKRIVSCPYKPYGCTKPDIKYEELKQHETDCKIEHLQYQVGYLLATIKDQIGIIKMYSGNIDNIQKDWLLCNGNNGTPDLSKKFVPNQQDDDDDDDNKQIESYALCYIVRVSS